MKIVANSVRLLSLGIGLVAATWSLEQGARAQSAADFIFDADFPPSGPFKFVEEDYKLAAQKYPEVLDGITTEIWGRLYLPDTSAKAPLIVLKHGNHGTCGSGQYPRVDNSCEYTNSGTCPNGKVVVPNHRGYDYVARDLASNGYAVISINSNRGITCGGGTATDRGLIQARGKQILKHLEILSEWNATPGASLAHLSVDLHNRIDFSEVGMMGHSRGGEGIRAAYNIYKDAGSPWVARIKEPVTFKGLYEIGPVDGMAGRVLNASDVAWSVLLPKCDGDVFDNSGVRVFDRMLVGQPETNATPKSILEVWGANHNFFNTEWQVSDAGGCNGPGHSLLGKDRPGKLAQLQIGYESMRSFFMAHVGVNRDETLVDFFDPAQPVAAEIADLTRFARDYVHGTTVSRTLNIEGFANTAGLTTASVPYVLSPGVSVEHTNMRYHDRSRKVARIKWTPGQPSSLELPMTGTNQFDRHATLDMSITRGQLSSVAATGVKDGDPLQVSVELKDLSGNTSRLAIEDYADFYFSVGSGGAIELMSGVRMPLVDFQGVDLAAVQSISIILDNEPSGLVYLSNLRLSDTLSFVGGIAPTMANIPVANNVVVPALEFSKLKPAVLGGATPRRGEVKGVLRAKSGLSQAKRFGLPQEPVVIRLHREEGFPVRALQPVLQIGEKVFDLSGFADGDTRNLEFAIPRGDWAKLRNAGAQQAFVRYGDQQADWAVNLDKIDVGSLNPVDDVE